MLNIFEAAAFLAISEQDLHRLVSRGEIEPIRDGPDLRFKRDDLERYLRRKSSMTRWEYLFVEVQEDRRVPRPATLNGEPLTDWKRGPSIYEFAAQLGEEGWEMVSTHDTDKGVIVGMIYKRRKLDR